MSPARIAISVLCVIIMGAGMLATWALGSHAPLPLDPSWEPLPEGDTASGEVTVCDFFADEP